MSAVNVVETVAYTANVQVPSNGDPADQTAWLVGAQPLANRTAWLKQQIETAGVLFLRTGDSAAMIAATGMTEGAVFLVKNQGLYQYFANPGLSTDLRYVYPTSVGGTSRWVLKQFTPNALILLGEQLGTVAANTTSGLVTTYPGTSTAIAVELGDKLIVDWHHQLENLGVGDSGIMEVGWTPPAGVFTVLKTFSINGSTAGLNNWFSWSAVLTAAAAGSAGLSVKFATIGGTTTVKSGSIRYQLIRP